MHNKALAVIINTCNRPFLLKKLVSQLKPQLKDDDTTLIVNDGDEGSVHKLGLNYPTILHCKPYYALASGRNEGAKTAINMGYDWGLFLDDDMEVESDLLRVHRNAWDEKEVAYAGRLEVPQYDDDVRKRWWNGKDDFVIRWGGCNASFHLPSLMNAGGYDESFDGNWGYEDNELYYRLVNEYDWKVEYLEDAVAINLEAPENGNYQRYSTANKDKLTEQEAYYEEHLVGNNND